MPGQRTADHISRFANWDFASAFRDVALLYRSAGVILCLVTYHFPSAVLSLMFALSLCACGGGGRMHALEQFKDQTTRDIADIRAVQAEHNAILGDIRAQFRELTGKVEEAQHLSVGRTQELERTLQRFGTRVPPPEGIPSELLSRDEDAIARNTGPAAELYRTALNQLRTGEFERAAVSFEEFVTQNPGTAFTDNALFWTALCREKMEQYDRAVSSYNEILQKYPAEDMVPMALLRLADNFARIGLIEDAVITLDKFIDEFPRHSMIAQAKKRRAELGQQKKRRG